MQVLSGKEVVCSNAVDNIGRTLCGGKDALRRRPVEQAAAVLGGRRGGHCRRITKIEYSNSALDHHPPALLLYPARFDQFAQEPEYGAADYQADKEAPYVAVK